METTLPVLLVPGLVCSARIWAPVVPRLWQFGPVTIATHTRDDNMGAIARRILAAAPPRFALAGHSMGGYISLEIMRQAPERVIKLALMNTRARTDAPEAIARRQSQVARAKSGAYAGVLDDLFLAFVQPSRQEDASLRELVHAMGMEVGAEAFIRQQTAIMARPDLRGMLSSISCPTLVLTSDQDATVPPALSAEIAGAIPGATLTIIPDCGYLCQLEQPQATADALVEWLRD